MHPLPVWHDIDPTYGVLELHERMTAPGPPLELHVVVDSETGGTAAWWENDEGTWLWIAEVGKA